MKDKFHKKCDYLFSQAHACFEKEKEEIKKAQEELESKNYRYSTYIQKDNEIQLRILNLSCFDYLDEYINYLINKNPYRAFEEKIKMLGGKIPEITFTYDGLKDYVSKTYGFVRDIKKVDGKIERLNSNILCLNVPLLSRRYGKGSIDNLNANIIRKEILEQNFSTLLAYGLENNLYKKNEFDNGIIVFCHMAHDETMVIDGDNFDTKHALDCIKNYLISSDHITNISTLYMFQKGKKTMTKIYALKEINDILKIQNQ